MAFTPLFDALFYGNAQHNRLIKLDTPLGDDWLVPLQAKGTSRLGRDYEFVVDAASSYGDRIELKALIAQPVTLWVQQADRTYLPHHGYVKSFSRMGSDGYLTYYQLRFCSWMCFLPLRRDLRDWQEQTGEQIVADVFDAHPQAQGAFRFELGKRCRSIRTVCNGKTIGTSCIEAWKRRGCSAASSKPATGSRIRSC